jgi:hypothetical protein
MKLNYMPGPFYTPPMPLFRQPIWDQHTCAGLLLFFALRLLCAFHFVPRFSRIFQPMIAVRAPVGPAADWLWQCTGSSSEWTDALRAILKAFLQSPARCNGLT